METAEDMCNINLEVFTIYLCLLYVWYKYLLFKYLFFSLYVPIERK